jgi:hypothetical protein
MASEGYFRKRIFRSPLGSQTQSVSGASIVWALLSGPIYFWRKRAPVEALLLFVAQLILYFVPDETLDGDIADLLGTLLWLGSALAAPLLLALCYERKGWMEQQPFEERVRSRLGFGEDDLERDMYREGLNQRTRTRPF